MDVYTGVCIVCNALNMVCYACVHAGVCMQVCAGAGISVHVLECLAYLHAPVCAFMHVLIATHSQRAEPVSTQ